MTSREEEIKNNKTKIENLNLDSDSEFYDAPQELFEDDEEDEMRIQEKLLADLALEQKQNEKDESTIKDFDSTTKLSDAKDENKHVPLHERLNQERQQQKEQQQASTNQHDVESNESETDPYFVNEEELKILEEQMSDEQKESKLNESQNLKQLGNDVFKSEDYMKALDFYTQALKTCPLKYEKERAVFYSNRSACYFKMKQNESCIKECTKSIELDPSFVKPILRRAECNQLVDKLEDALEDYKKLSELEPRNNGHKLKVYELEQKIKERNEKLKEEMMGKLKELGNLVLKPFGLSTNNFQFVQDPNTGSYSVNFQK